MSYTIIKTDGTVLTTIADGTLNTTSTSVALPGRLYPGYGQVVDTNFVHILENFADVAPPENPLQGQLWFNTNDPLNPVLQICPSDGETNALAWFTVVTVGASSDVNAGNVTATGNVDANNVNVTNTVTANLVDTDYLTVNIQANIANATVTGNITAANLTGNHFGNGAALSAIAGANVTGTVANATAAATVAVASQTSSATTFYPVFVTGVSSGTQLGFDSALSYLPSSDTLTIGNLTVSGLITGTISSATVAGTVTTAAQPNITSTGTLTSATVTGNVIAGNVYANSGTVGASLLTGTLTTAAQPNITSVGTLTSLGVTGIATASRFTSTVAVGTAPLTVTSTTKVTNLNADLLDGYDADITATASTIALRDTAGNVAANYFIGNGALLTGLSTGSVTQIFNGSSNVSVPAAGGNVNISVGGVANTVVASGTGLGVTGNIVAGNLSATGITGSLITASQPNITVIGTLSSLIVTGNVTGANFTGNHFGSGAALTSLPAANISGTVALANYSTFAGAVTLTAQPNITSTGTLTAVLSSGNVTAPNVVANTGAFYGSGAGLTSIPGANVTGTVANATYAVSAGSVFSATIAGTVTTGAQPNISSLGTLTSLNVLNKVTAGQLQGDGGNISNIRAGNVQGAVSFATTANSVAGANVSGAVSFATTANAVAGGNVSGTVANATYATSAGSATTATSATNATNATTVSSITSGQVISALGYTPVSVADFTNGSGAVSGGTGYWCRLPNGLLLQWGTTTVFKDSYTTVYFPQTFSGTPGVSISGGVKAGDVSAQENPATLTSVGPSYFQCWQTENVPAGGTTAWWTAIGFGT